MSTSTARSACGLVIAGLLLAACRGDVSPYETEVEGVAGGPVRQLTFSAKNDRSPVWPRGSDSVYYSAEGFGPLAGQPGVLYGLPVEGGEARPIFGDIQFPDARPRRWLVAPTADPAGEQLAFIEITSLWDRDPCPGIGTDCVPEMEEAPLPPLRQIVVRVRRLDAIGPLEDGPALKTSVPGVTVELRAVRHFIVHVYPFQRIFDLEEGFTFRPTWSPAAGQQLAFSSGLGILVWTVGDPQPAPLPGSEDGVWPAWSPDGGWIAFTRLERVDSTSASCVHYGPLGGIACTQERTEYIDGPHTLSLIRPDGSELIELGEGDEPAWSPDGAQLFFRRGDQIWRSDRDGTNATAIPNTGGGREPAVSPDGKHLAFARLSSDGDYDIWVIALESLP